jgi:hypothetical protein
MKDRVPAQLLTNLYVNALGRKHHKRRSVKERICFSLWCCPDERERNIALELCRYATVSRPHDKWIYLADTYARLPDNNCGLAKDIRQLFQNTFDMGEIPVFHMQAHHYRYGCVYEKIHYDPAKVSVFLRQAIDHFYGVTPQNQPSL